jgi:heme A synthase
MVLYGQTEEYEMKRRWFGALCVFWMAVTPVLFAGPPAGEQQWDLSEEEMLPYNTEIEGFLAERAAMSVGDVTIAEMRELGSRLSVVAQEESYVRSARHASQAMPGAGHFMIGENGRGAAYMTGSVLVVAATVVGAYLVLPNGVQFHELDYINDSFGDIERAWRGESIASVAPAFGVLLAGGVVHSLLGALASGDAEERAREQIVSGEKRFEPKPFIYPDTSGRLVLGARMGL